MEVTHNNTKYKFFWNGIFSNWHPSLFTVNGLEYNCGEQWMMYQKAMLFNDTNTARLIMALESAKRQKELGRSVKKYDDKIWTAKRYDLVKTGLREKFIQNPDMKSYLLKYRGYVIVEASPYDRIWGIGYEEEEAIAHINKWGQNLLGKMLTELSNEL